MKELRIVLNDKNGQTIYSKSFFGNAFAYVEGETIKVINIDKKTYEEEIRITNEVHSYSIYNY